MKSEKSLYHHPAQCACRPGDHRSSTTQQHEISYTLFIFEQGTFQPCGARGSLVDELIRFFHSKAGFF